MSTLLNSEAKAEALAAIGLTQAEAAAYCKLSAKTLERLAARGEPLGRIRIGRRVVFLKAMLESWFASKASSAVPSLTPAH